MARQIALERIHRPAGARAAMRRWRGGAARLSNRNSRLQAVDSLWTCRLRERAAMVNPVPVPAGARKRSDSAQRAARGVMLAMPVPVLVAACGIHIDTPEIPIWQCTIDHGWVSLEPAHAVVAVGATIEFAVVNPSDDEISWRRCAPDGACADLAGVTGARYTLQGVNLGDDGSRIEVTARNVCHVNRGSSLVEVLPAPGTVFSDGEFKPSDWELQIFEDTGGHSRIDAVQSAAGGHPGAYLGVTYEMPTLTESLQVFHGATQTTYDPAVDGALYAINYAADRAPPPSTDVLGPAVLAALRQGGRWYMSWTWGLGWPGGEVWYQAFARTSLLANDFQLIAGPACEAGERCPDFSASALPITFGFVALANNPNEGFVRHTWLGLDNWKLTVWRKPS